METSGDHASLAALGLLTPENLRSELLRCCGSSAWVEGMVRHTPFSSKDQLFEVASTVWWNLPPSEWLVAFSAHPQIGDASALKSKFAHSKWEGDEQKGANSASEGTLKQLADLNAKYLAKNGFIFLICATGKSALEMVEALQLRMMNDKETELQIAAGEQDKITKLRLMKILHDFEEKTESIQYNLSKL